MTASPRAWISAPRPLPRQVSAVQGETVEHFIERLARANHLNTSALLGYLSTRGPGPTTVDPVRLAAATEQSLERITRRVPGLAWAHRSPGPNPYIRPACWRCMARRGLLDPVPCHIPAHLSVCPRHQLWIGVGARSRAQQLDLRAFPEMHRAQRRHHRLRLRHDPPDVVLARHHAERLVGDRAARAEWSPGQQRRLTGLAPQIWARVAPDAPSAGRGSFLGHVAVKIATYPEVIDHTSVLLRRLDPALLRRHPDELAHLAPAPQSRG